MAEILIVNTPKEVAAMIHRSPKWVAAQCRKGKFPTLAPHRRPYLIPIAALFRGTQLPSPPAK